MSSHLDKVSDAIPDSAKQFYGRWSWLAPWLVGGIVGLVLGLVIGWVVWPVEWTNARLGDLTQRERAAYISAVADAFVLDGSGYQEVNMYARLEGFGDMLPDEVLSAIEYLQADPATDQVQLGNLALLATQLGIPVDATALQSAAPLVGGVGEAAQSGALESAPIVPSDQTTTTESQSSGIWAWLLAIVVAGGLIGGGLYLLRYLNKRALPSDELIAPPPASLPGEIRAPQEIESSSGPKRASLWRESSKTPSNKAPDDLSFEEEDEDEEPAVRFGAGDFDDGYDDDEDEDDNDPVNDQRYGAPTRQPERPTAPAFPGAAVSAPYNGPSFGSSAYSAPNAPSSGASPHLRASATAEALHPAPVPVRNAPRRRTESVAAEPAVARKVVASYICEYQSGMPGYIDAHNINDPVTGLYIGECGLCESSKNRALHNNPDEVIALEVWMYDKKDSRNTVSSTGVLLSEYAADRDFAQVFAREREGLVKTMLASPGTKFRLDGKNLILEAEIVSVAFDRDGIFSKAKVALNVLAK